MNKKLFLYICVLIAIVGSLILSKYLLVGKELDIAYISTQKHTSKDLGCLGGLNTFNWFIVSTVTQRINLEESGYHLPEIDFNKHYLILSRFKISKLYQSIFKCPCSGVPKGRLYFDKENSKDDSYYVYLMPPIMLSQGIG